jgi:hypothetical protein
MNQGQDDDEEEEDQEAPDGGEEDPDHPGGSGLWVISQRIASDWFGLLPLGLARIAATRLIFFQCSG